MLKILYLLVASLISVSVYSAEPNTVTIFKQWHLAPTMVTIDVEKSQLVPQYKNQKQIYTDVLKLIDEGKTSFIIAEGCEGVIDSKFKYKHNGWNYSELEFLKQTSTYPDIMAHIPLKLKVIRPDKIKAVCADDDGLIKKNTLAFSDLRAFVGFVHRLTDFKNKNDTDGFKKYSESLYKITNINAKKEPDAIKIAKKEGLKALKAMQELIAKRNKKFISLAEQNIKLNPVIIIGAMHAEGISKELQKQHIAVKTITPEDVDYAEELEHDLNKIKKIFE